MKDAIIVETGAGPIAGRRQGGILRFLGIPYAKAPSGALRFAAPQPARRFDAPFPAFDYGAAAPQRRLLPEPLARIAGTTLRFGEDCLNLNIWTPGLDGRRPVLVFIHGGGFIMGSGAQYPGDELARRGDIVTVTLNYRLGLLGFNAFSELFPDDPRFAANAGLLDQIAALRWIKANIDRFGGDPDAVTIAGESAGAVSVAVHLVHRPSAALFARAIIQSGGLNLIYPKAEAVRVTRDILSELGVSSDPAPLFRHEPRAFGGAMRRLATRHVGILSRPYADGAIIPERPLAALHDATAPVPLIIGTNRDEFSFFSDLPMFPVHTEKDALLRVLAPAADARRMDVLRALYADTWAGRIALGTDIMFRMPAIHLADRHAARAPTFAYRLDWEAKGLLAKLGATHTVDLPLLFEDFLKPFRSIYLGVPARRPAPRPGGAHARPLDRLRAGGAAGRRLGRL